jgi:hypothetical protein
LHGIAYYIFLKSLRSLEEFKKNPDIKIPLKPPYAIFQILGIFKNPIFILKIYSLQDSAQPPNRPIWPFSPPGPTGLSSSSRTEARSHRPCADVQYHPAMDALPRAPHRILCPLPLLPSSFHRVKRRLKSEPFHPINTGNSSALTTSPSATIKREEPRHPPPPLPLLSFPTLHA